MFHPMPATRVDQFNLSFDGLPRGAKRMYLRRLRLTHWGNTVSAVRVS